MKLDFEEFLAMQPKRVRETRSSGALCACVIDGGAVSAPTRVYSQSGCVVVGGTEFWRGVMTDVHAGLRNDPHTELACS